MIHGQPNLYNTGAVTGSSQPSVNLYAQLMARQQAKKDALDQYYSKALSDVTPAGMRNKDVTEGWAKKVNDWQEFGMNPDNRKKLINPRLDNYKTLTTFNQMHQDLLNDAQKSKEELKDEATINQQRANSKRAFTDEDMNIMHRKSLSIYDPSRKDENGNEPDITQLSVNQPEFTPLEEKQYYSAASQGILPKNKTPDSANQRKENGYIYTPFTKSFSADQIKAVADNFASNLTKRASIHYEQLMHDPDIYNAATTAYQNVYGKNELIDTPQKMAKGIAAIHALGQVETGEDKIPDLALAQQRKQSNIDRNNYYRSNNPQNIIKNANDYINDDIRAGQDNGGVIQPPEDNFKALFGRNYQSNKDVVKVDGNGTYTLYGKKYDSNKGEYVDAPPVTLTKDQAIVKLTKFLHTGLGGTNTGTNPPPVKHKIVKIKGL